MKRRLCIRTVLDARSPSTKYLFQLLLLVASWHKRVRNNAPLEVFIVGQPPEGLLTFLRDYGVRWVSVAADANDSFSKTSNTISGARDRDGSRVLLVDNDVVFLGDLAGLTQIGDDVCLGSVAGSERVNKQRWQLIENHFDMSLLPTTQVPLAERVRHMVDSSHAPVPLRNVYVNGGVLLVPPDAGFEESWRRYVREIAGLFEHHPLKSGCVYGSNMAALALAISVHKNFDWLDLKYNYRPDCFALGVEPYEEIQIAHLTGMDASHRTLSGRIDAFWKYKMLCRLEKAAAGMTESEQTSRMKDIMRLRAELDDLVREYELEHRAEKFPRNAGHLWKSTWRRHVNQPLHRLYGQILSSAARVRRRFAA